MRLDRPATRWQLGITSALLYTLAFNVIFFAQELFLVLPKALTPGLRPTLFHNNHTWQGSNPRVGLLQGTGALAILSIGVTCAWLLPRARRGSSAVRLLLIWLAYNGLVQSLLQVIIGAFNPGNDVGMAMSYLRLGAAVKTLAAAAAFAAIAAFSRSLAPRLLSLAEEPADLAGARARSGFVMRVATLPVLAAIVLIIPFRVPRGWIEVALVPVIVSIAGMPWWQLSARRLTDVKAAGRSSAAALGYSLGAVVLLLILFQGVLRPGIRFF